MSERERWIVYPLLFFALGAALRDKVTQRVESKEILCQRLRIVDQHDSNVVLAEVGASRLGDENGHLPRSFLRVDDMMCLGGVQCEGLSVVNEKDPENPLIVLATGPAPNYEIDKAPKLMGVVVLRDNASEQVSELRADQILGSRMVCNQIFVRNPENGRPLVYVGTEAIPGISLNDEDPGVSHQGVIVLNNQHLGLRLAPPTATQPSRSEAP
ncbi:MAG: hypothetical protein MK171_01820 [Pirellulales bacterium]|nr:hypothetical protein [Pirellulales bacterium]